MSKKQDLAYALLVAGVMLVTPHATKAACVSPAGNAGDQIYNSSYDVMQFCNDTDWVGMGSTGVGKWLENTTNIYFDTGSVGIGTTDPFADLHVVGKAQFGSVTSTVDTLSNGLSVTNTNGSATSLLIQQSGIGSGHVGFKAGDPNLYIFNTNTTGDITDATSKGIAINTAGDVTIGSDLIVTGDITTADGTIRGEVLVSDTSVTATGALIGDSAAVTNAITSATLTTTGAISGASVGATGTVSGATVSSSGDINAVGAVTGATVTTTGMITAGGAIHLANEGAATACAGANLGDMRYNSVSKVIEACDGAGTWSGATGGGGANAIDDLGDAITNATSVFLGNNSGVSNIGSDNTAVGIDALFSNVGGTDNSTLGYRSLYLNTTGSYNSAFGRSAMRYNTTGDRNTAIGYSSLYNNVGKDHSTAIGFYSMYYADDTAADDISYNTAVGAYSLQGSNVPANNTGISNTALGHSALMDNTTGSQNTATGVYSLTNNTTGNYNVGSGYGSLYLNSTGSSNIAFGVGALASNVGGNNNTALGFQAGYNSTGSGNILIGANINAINAGGDNQLNIGDLIYGDLGAGQISFGNGVTAFVSGIGVDMQEFTTSMRPPVGSIAERPNCSGDQAGAFRYNSENREMEYCNGTVWGALGTSGTGGTGGFLAGYINDDANVYSINATATWADFVGVSIDLPAAGVYSVVFNATSFRDGGSTRGDQGAYRLSTTTGGLSGERSINGVESSTLYSVGSPSLQWTFTVTGPDVVQVQGKDSYNGTIWLRHPSFVWHRLDVAGSTGSNLSRSMKSGWPDAIKCEWGGDGYSRVHHLLLSGASYTGYRFSSGSTTYDIDFNADGTWKSNVNTGVTDCDNKTISELYDDYQAFDLVGGDTTASSESMAVGFPDVIKCDVSDPAWGQATFHLSLAPYSDGLYYYKFINTGGGVNYNIIFNADGTFNNYANLTTTDCNKTITQLYDAGQAFNTVSQASTTEASMVNGWPDSIRCDVTGWGETVFYLTGAPFGGAYRYASVGFASATDYYVNFGSDGSFSGFSNTPVSADCSKSITQLYAEGKAFNLVGGSGDGSSGGTSNVSNQTKSMVAQWPDAIKCNTTSPAFGPMILQLKFAPATSDGLYYYRYTNPTAYYDATFNADGTFANYQGIVASDCDGKTITELYADGQAFDMVGGEGLEASASMVDGWPDTIVCDVATPGWGKTKFDLEFAPYDGDGLYYYGFHNGSDNVLIKYNPDGSFNGYNSNISASDCNKTITELYDAGQAFNTHTQTSNVEASMTFGWPDSIKCEFGGDQAVFFAALSPHSTGKVYYRLIHSDTDFAVIFLSDGSWSNTLGGIPTGCDNKTITQLYAEGRAFSLVGGGGGTTTVSSNVSNQTKSMVAQWPDAIKCNVTGDHQHLLYHSYAPATDGAHRYNSTISATGIAHVGVMFNADGTWNSNAQLTASDCDNKTITELYDDYQAFDLVGGNSTPVSESMVTGWPDNIVCSNPNGDVSSVVFDLTMAPDQFGLYNYRYTTSGTTYTIKYNADGTWATYSGTLTSTADCDSSKTITQLYEDGQAFNTVSQTSNSESSMVFGWPDAIKCDVTTPDFGTIIFELQLAPHSTGDYYYRLPYENNYYSIIFNADGSFKSFQAGVVSPDCDGKSITQLYAEKKAFSLVGGGGADQINDLADAKTNEDMNSIFLGLEAGALSTGTNNVALGYQAADNLTTGTDNIIIGAGVDAMTIDGNNQLNIGNTIYGDTSTNQLAFGNGVTAFVSGIGVDMNTLTTAMRPPVGTNAQQPTCDANTAGGFRYNSESAAMEYCNGTIWGALGTGGGSSVPGFLAGYSNDSTGTYRISPASGTWTDFGISINLPAAGVYAVTLNGHARRDGGSTGHVGRLRLSTTTGGNSATRAMTGAQSQTVPVESDTVIQWTFTVTGPDTVKVQGYDDYGSNLQINYPSFVWHRLDVAGSTGSNLSRSMVSGWPDTIKCHVTAPSDIGTFVFNLLAAPSSGLYYYRFPHKDTNYEVRFNPDGTLESYAGFTASDCDGKTITELYDDYQAFDLVGGDTTASSESMAVGFPDVLKCNITTPAAGHVIMSLRYAPTAAGIYTYMYSDSGTDYMSSFNADGSFNSHFGLTTSDCNKSISQLYTDGQAFNTVSQSSTTAASMVNGWPDAIMCDATTPDYGMTVFRLAFAPHTNGYYYYRHMDASNTYYIAFNPDGTWYPEAGITPSDCDGKSITQLYAEQKAFSLVGGAGGGAGSINELSDGKTDGSSVFLGSGSGADSTGDFNTALGYNSLTANVDGAHNVAIGNRAGDNLTTGSSNIIIGSNVDALNAIGSDQLNIGGIIHGDTNNNQLAFGSGVTAFVSGVDVDMNTMTSAMRPPSGTTAERPATCDANTAGAFRYNTESTEMEYCNGLVWGALGSGGGASGVGTLAGYKNDAAGTYNITPATWTNFGTSISLPAAGVYKVTLSGTGFRSGGTRGDQSQIRLSTTTGGLSGESRMSGAAAFSTQTAGSTVIQWTFTVTGPDTVQVQGLDTYGGNLSIYYPSWTWHRLDVAGSTGSNLSRSMVSGWPDSVKCNVTGWGPTIFFLKYAPTSGLYHYKSAHQSTDYTIMFNPDGTAAGDLGVPVSDCDGKTITELYDDYQAFDLVGGDTTASSESMSVGFPDSIKCTSSTHGNTPRILWLAAAPDTNSKYVYSYPDDGQQLVRYNADGTYSDSTGITTTDCNKSITDLYTDGQAFNTVSQASTTEASMINAFPDALKCDWNGAASVFYLTYMNTHVVYRYPHSESYYDVNFNLDGSFKNMVGITTGQLDCENKSITQLYAEQKAFSLVGGRGDGVAASTVENPTGSITPNWPDAIKCDTASWGKTVFHLMLAPHSNGDSYYRMISSSTDYEFIFNSDGTWKSDNVSVSDCDGKTITELYADNQAFNFVANAKDNQSKSMVAQWPDTIKCTWDAHSIILNFVAIVNTTGLHSYRYNSGGVDYDVNFSADGSFNAYLGAGFTTTDCNKTITELYDDGQAFDLVGGEGIASSESMVDGWPDSLKCNVSSPNMGVAIFNLIHAPYADGLYYYRYTSSNATDYDIRFNADGTFVDYSNLTTTDCNKTITELYDGAQAFNTHTQTSNAEASMTFGWPDVLKCNVTSPNWGQATFHVVHTPHVSTGRYYYRSNHSSADYDIVFNADGSFYTYNGLTTTDCNKSITQLYAEQKAFSLVGGRGDGVAASTVENPTGSMIPNWPDAIKCEWNGNPSTFYLISKTITQIDYRYIHAANTYDIEFSPDGSFLSLQNLATGVVDCENKSITELYADNQAFNFVANAKDNQSKSMVAQWPDTIKCTWDAHSIILNFVAIVNTTGLHSYRYNSGGVDYDVNFSADGSFNAYLGAGFTTTDCNKTITELYDDGQAFDLVGGEGIESSESMVDGWPDTIVCNVSSPDWGASVFNLIHSPYTNGLYYYRFSAAAATYDVRFNADGTFDSYTNLTTTDCNKTITELYDGAQAFNTHTQTSNSEASMEFGWPDVIKCNFTNPAYGEYFLYQQGVNNHSYVNHFNSTTWAMYFTADGAYSSNQNITASDCHGKTITQLYASGQAFSLVGGRGDGSSATTVENPTGSMVTSWPDAIKCNMTNPAWGEVALMLVHSNNLTNGGLYHYRMAQSGAQYDVKFNSDGSFQGYTTFVASDCDNKTITELYADDQAFNFVANARDNQSKSMVAQWPDTIKCDVTTPAWGPTVLNLINGPYVGDGLYYYRFIAGSGTDYNVKFNADGTFNSYTTITASDCDNKTITELYDAGQAFDLVGGEGIESSESMVDGWPDTIRCVVTTPDIGSVPFSLHNAPNSANGLYYYRFKDGTNDGTIRFNADGTFAVYSGAISASDCDGKTITELYDGAQAFNTHTQTSNSEASMVFGWPDAIKCNITSPNSGTAIFWLTVSPNLAGTYTYKYIHDSMEYAATFNADGSFAYYAGLTTTDCGKSITQLYAEQKAFSLVGGRGDGVAAGTVENPTGSMVTSWPDAIKCTASSGGPMIFPLVRAPYSSNNHYYYRWNGSGTDYAIQFNADGTFASEDIATDDCDGKTITQLYADDQAFNFVANAKDNQSKSMVAQWPDTIKCDVTDPTYSVTVLNLIHAPFNDGLYYYRYISSIGDVYVAYNADGSFNKYQGITTSDCNKTITELYDDGQAFDLVGGEGIASSESMVDGWPDTIKCNVSSPAFGTVIFDLAFGPNAADLYYYRLINSGTSYDVIFNADGTFSSYNSVITSDCNKTITELYDGAQAFNTHTQTSNAEASMVNGFPDSIKCNVTNPNWGEDVLYLTYAPNSTTGLYWYSSINASLDYNIRYNPDGSFNSYNNIVATDCNKSITQLYAEGKAFSLVGGRGDGVAASTVENPTGSMVAQWPDAIKCDVNNTGTTDIMLHLLYIGGEVRYRYSTAGASYDINFNLDGSFKDYNTITSSNCEKTITELYADDQAFNFVANAKDNQSKSMVAQWPDTIRCEITDPTSWGTIVLPLVSSPSGDGKYYYIYNSKDNNYFIKFNADGTFDSYTGFTTTDCNKTITELYDDGQAFDLVGGEGIASSESMVDGWPDTIKCNLTNPAWGQTVFNLTLAPYTTDGLYYYRNSHPTALYDVKFNADGTFNSYNGLTTTDCNKTITELYDGAQAFNTHTQTSNSEASMVHGWPDTIKCTWGGSEGVFYVGFAPNADGAYYYRFIHSSTSYQVYFNADGSFNGAQNVAGSDCEKSITQLYADGQAFSLVGGRGDGVAASTVENPTGSMVVAWPDAIKCDVSDPAWDQTVLHLIHAPYTGGKYYYRFMTAGATNYTIVFNADGTFDRNWNLTTTDCDNKSITELYANDQAFNFVANAKDNQSKSMVAQWPDSIKCDLTSPNYGQTVFNLQYAPYSDGDYYYRFNAGSTVHDIRFNADGSFNTYNANLTTTDCNKTITELYDAGQAFDLVGGEGIASSESMVDGWPDSIRCAVSDPNWGSFVFNLTYSPNAIGLYYYSYDRNATSYDVIFNADGTFASYNGLTTTDCNKTITELYDGAQAFNTHTQTSNSEASMVFGWPDAIKCNVTTPNWGPVIFNLMIVQHATTGEAYYSTDYATINYTIRFTSDGMFAATSNVTSTDCTTGTSITQLYAEGKAFSLVGGRGDGSGSSNGVTNPTGSMASNFPDAIKCEVTGPAVWGPTVFYLTHANTAAANTYYYRAIVDGANYSVVFNADGSFNTYSGSLTATADCNKTITELYADNKAFNFVANARDNQSKSMVAQWPDTIKCDLTGPAFGTTVFNLMQSPHADGLFYYRTIDPNTVYSIKFNADGTFASYAGVTASDCNKTITELYDAGQAFDLVGGEGIASSESMVDGWPDSLKCNVTSPNWGVTTFELKYAPYNDGLYYYRNSDPDSYYNIKFNADGTFNSYVGLTTTDCNKTITELYDGAQAFNTHTQTSNAEASMAFGWPDSIKCDVTGWGQTVFFLKYAPYNNGQYMYIMANNNTNYQLIFDADGSFSAFDNVTSTDCNKSITQLYAEGKAFSLVGGRGDGVAASTVENPTGSMVAQWPDAIRCDVVGWGPAVFNLNHAPLTSNGLYYYRTSGSVSDVIFNPDGSFNSYTSITTTDCEKTITELYADDQAYNFVANAKDNQSKSMVAQWPDTIKCDLTSPAEGPVILDLRFAPHVSNGLYYYRYSSSAVDFNVRYNADGTWNSYGTIVASDCDNKTITELYDDGQAFDLVGGEGIASSESMVDGWPDTIKCTVTSPNWGPVIFNLVYASLATDGTYRYRVNHPTTEYQIYFDADGTFAGFANITAADCDGKTITELYDDAQAFNTHTQTSNSEASMVFGWPDAIKCNVTSPNYGVTIFNLIYAGYGGGTTFYYRADNADTPQIAFSGSGAYSATQGVTTTDCDGKSITQLYAEDKAFSLVGGRGDGSGGGASAINDLTDGIADTTSIFLGTGAGANDDGTDNENTAVGINTLAANTTGANNSAFGNDALMSNVDGSWNTALGRNSMQLNISGTSNTAVGANVLYSNTVGTRNTVLGNDALLSNVAKSDSTAIGFYSMQYADNYAVDDNTISYNTAVGAYSLRGSSTPENNTGTANTALGHSAMMSNTSGGWNTATGYNALSSNTEGAGNMANGYAALLNNTTGDYNNAIGASALRENVSGGWNVAVGSSALRFNTVGNYNVAGGHTALAYNTVGDNNVASGYEALYSNVARSDSTAIGHWSMRYADDCDSQADCGGTPGSLISYNTAIGAYSLQGSNVPANNTGTANTAIGHSAMMDNISGNYNVAIGDFALSTNATRGDNTAIGHYAMQYADDTTIEVESYNTAVGSYSMRGSSTSANNTGHRNTAIGSNSLRSNTKGHNNMASGVSSLYFNTEGNYNTALGRAALYSNATKHESTAVGYHSMYYADSAIADEISYNTAIGTYSLEGSEIAANNTGTRNTALGHSALRLNTSGAQNSAVGFLALINNASGDQNTATGYSALSSNVTGSRNVAMGRRALYSSLAKSDSTAIGYHSMYYADDCDSQADCGGDPEDLLSYNTAIGAYSLQGSDTPANNTGKWNTAIGHSSLMVNTSGYSNTATGHAALYTNSTGSENTATGVSALRFNTTGEDNTSTGRSSLRLNTTGSENTATGRSALYTNTIGGENTATGRSSLRLNTVGNKNTATGMVALYENVAKSESTALGYASMQYAHDCDSQADCGGEAEDLLSFNTAVGAYSLQGAENGQATNTGKWNTALGHSALKVNTSGNYNTAVGWEALTSNTEGHNNVAVGREALRENTTGDLNTASGIWSLVQNTEGGSNAAHGYASLYSNITGSYNAAYGTSALRWNTVGINNAALGQAALYTNRGRSESTALGYWAMRYADNTLSEEKSFNTAVGAFALQGAIDGEVTNTGRYNTALGHSALIDNTSGSNNVALGDSALESNAAMSDNTAVGHNSMLYANSAVLPGNGYNTALGSDSLRGSTTASANTGTYNTALGYATLSANSSGFYNTAIGAQALVANSTGDYNVGMGYLAGDNVTSGSYNIVIGAGMDVPVASDSYQLNIGDTITGDLSTGDVAIAGNLKLAMVTGAAAPLNSSTSCLAASTGGTKTVNGDYNIHKFLVGDTFNVPLGCDSKSVTYMVVAGGGAGGNSPDATYRGGGGGAGGYRTGTLAVSGGDYIITIGAGGATSGANGGDSVFSTITSTGGGGGGNASGGVGGPGKSGGSGGGGSGGSAGAAGAGNTPSTTPAQGTNGVAGNPAGYAAGAGGGLSATSSITGVSTTYSNPGGAGTGGSDMYTNANDNTGDGGGGGSAENGWHGGSGIVVIRYSNKI